MGPNLVFFVLYKAQSGENIQRNMRAMELLPSFIFKYFNNQFQCYVTCKCTVHVNRLLIPVFKLHYVQWQSNIVLDVSHLCTNICVV